MYVFLNEPLFFFPYTFLLALFNPLVDGRFARSLLRSAARPGPAPRGIVSGPPQHPLGTAESVVGLLAMFVTCLGPAAWVLSHLEDYKKRE